MNNFMNKSEKGMIREELVDAVSSLTNFPYIDILIMEGNKEGITVAEQNRIVHKHMMSLIHEFHLEYNDFKVFIQEWEESMKEEEKIRREMWD